MKKIILLLVLIVAATACNETKKNTEEKAIPVEKDNGIGDGAVSLSDAFAQGIEKAHNKEGYTSKKAISYDLLLHFNGKLRLDVKVTSLTNSSKIRYDFKDGSSIIYDGSEVYLSPANKELKSARFDIFTWSYFMSMPFKLTDPGTQWSGFEQKMINEEEVSRAKLSFKSDVGDTSDDWYMVYTDPETNLLNYAAYIVTFGKTVEKAEAAPHAIAYTNYTVVDGVAIADMWDFYNWSDEKELYGDSIGNATLTNITFLDDADFTVPADSKIVEAPKQD
ncbi:DUF6503 family protein [Ulvibacter litoralis]|uniref:Outer membrane lipoprotein-sorting protein n=1 Tax=Ulvibacter litoralis TaxID=227084 RepID=A0A1G7IW64_9FLAO|nr:DUF6503 family protein [Ulvibacter litoralis]GHC64938.1 hypothetical protein GCM10008083_32790 [Ulvibacter litoralis]SDF16826.1 hypothetical protein SAMN05421855_10747 [Ulvibacter litoralis]